jgi:hypothetical protein
MSDILPRTIEPPRLHDFLSLISSLPWRQTPWKSRDNRRKGSREIGWGGDQCHPGGPSSSSSQASNTCQNTASCASWYSIKFAWRNIEEAAERWTVTRDPALKNPVNRLQKPVACRLNGYGNEEGSDALESSHSKGRWLRKTIVCCEPRLSHPFATVGRIRCLRPRESGGPGRQCWV